MARKIFTEEKLIKFNESTPFFVFSKEALLNNLAEYKSYFHSNTEICYAMKANSEKLVLQILNKAGASFEVASKYELALLKNLKVPAKRIIYGTAVKPVDHIKEFVKYGVDRFAFDSEEELLKIAKYAPHSRVYIRALVDDKSDSVFKLSEKFGTPLANVTTLLLKAKELGLIPYGLSFNVGSQARNEESWGRGINDLAVIMKELLNNGIKIVTLNIGGGFPYIYKDNNEFPRMESISKYILAAIKNLPYSVNYIAEPGRGLVANAFALIVSVIGRNKRPNGNWLYVDAGIYNALLEASIHQGSTEYRIDPLIISKPSDGNDNFILTGPTGDNLDVVNRNVSLPKDIQAGDKLVIYDVGAYTFTLITPFNGFPKPKTVIDKSL